MAIDQDVNQSSLPLSYSTRWDSGDNTTELRGPRKEFWTDDHG